jgi:hypothetical protein
MKHKTVKELKIIFFVLLVIGTGKIMAQDVNQQIETLMYYWSQGDNYDDVINNFLQKFPDADILFIDDFIGAGPFPVCIRINQNNFNENNIGKYLGEIKRIGIQNNWKLWDATKLKIGTKIYQHKNERDIIIAVQDNQYIIYIAVIYYEI